jgi:hypothetical protein
MSAIGESFLPGGIGIKWGTASITTTNVNQTYGYVADFTLTAFATATYSVVITPRQSSQVQTQRIISHTAAGFTVNLTGTAPINFDWIAIGA